MDNEGRSRHKKYKKKKKGKHCSHGKTKEKTDETERKMGPERGREKKESKLMFAPAPGGAQSESRDDALRYSSSSPSD